MAAVISPAMSPAWSRQSTPFMSALDPLDADAGICVLPGTANSLSCFLASLKAKRAHADTFDDDVSTNCPDEPRCVRKPCSVAQESARGSDGWTKSSMLDLGAELLQAFSAPKFQKELKELLVRGPNKYEVVPGRMELAFKEQRRILPKYGFAPTFEGVEDMLEAISPFLVDKDVKNMVNDIDICLGLPHNSTAKTVLGQTPEEESEGEKTAGANVTRAHILMMASELLDAFQAPGFQAVLKCSMQGCSTPHSFAMERTSLAMSVQSVVLPKYGFPGTSEGVTMMLDAIAPYATDWMVAFALNDIDESLGQESGTTLSCFTA